MTAERDEAEIEASRMPLLDHLVELRSRLMYSMIAVLVCFIGGYFAAPYIFEFLMYPQVLAYGGNLEGRRMIFTAPQEAFFTNVKLAFWAAICLAFPIFATQIYRFVAPGLYKNERGAFLPFLVATPVLFFLGGALVYFLIMPMALKFFVGFETAGGPDSLPIVSENRVSEYLSLVMTLIFAFGLAFQLPVLLTLLAKVGIVSSAGLVRSRRYAIVAVFVFAAVVTPPDVISQVGLALPMLALYELSIFSARIIEKKRAKQEAADAAAEAAEEAAEKAKASENPTA
jgi:sec-independent protein translocase protein TatC